MRDYQPQKNNPYWIPHEQYMQTLYFIRSYYKMKEQHDDLIEQGKSLSDLDGMPHGTGVSDETAQKAIAAERLFNKIAIIDQAKRLIPDKYREAVWRNVMYREKYATIESERQVRKYKGLFVRTVAEKAEIYVNYFD